MTYASAGPVAITYDPYFSNVSLLLQGNGPVDSTVVTDSSTLSSQVTVSSTKLSATQSKFGGTSIYTGVPYSSGTFTVDLGAGLLTSSEYTVEMWVYYSGPNGAYQKLLTQGTPHEWSISPTGYLYFYADNYPVGSVNFTHQTQIQANTWTHVALVKTSNTVSMYVNGVKSTTNPTESDVRNVNTTVSTTNFPGYVDDYRITKGTARYTASFTPPTSQFLAIGPTDTYYNNVSLLLHGTGTNGSTTVLDSSLTAKAVSVTGSVQISTSQFKFNASSILFNGGYINLPASTDYQFGTGDFTIECWAYFTSVASSQIIIDQTPVGGPNSLRLGYGIYATGKLSVYDPAAGAITSSSTITANTWYHVAFARSSSQLKLFINGVAEASVASTTDLTSTNFLVGTNGYALGNSVFSGYIDDLRVTKGVARYTTAFTVPAVAYPNQGPTDAYYNNVSLLLHGDGNNTSTTITDNSPTPKTVTANGNAQISTSRFKFGAASVSFDGTSDYLSVPTSSGFDLGAGDFTIEFWYYPTTITSGAGIMGPWVSSGWLVAHPNPAQAGSPPAASVRFVASTGNSYAADTVDIYGTGTGSTIATNVWSHISVVRASGVFKLFLNGTMLTTTAIGTQASSGLMTIYNNGLPLKIGEFVTGYIDDLRITKGTARYTTSFSAPSSPFPNS